MGEFSGLQSFTNVQTRGFARHPGCSYSSQYFLLSWLSSRDFYIRTPHGSLPPRAPDMLTVQFGQLTVRGLAPLKIHSLVGCSRFSISILPSSDLLRHAYINKYGIPKQESFFS
jgi:hypothetical protein